MEENNEQEEVARILLDIIRRTKLMERRLKEIVDELEGREENSTEET